MIDNNVGVKPNSSLEAMGDYYRALSTPSQTNIFLSERTDVYIKNLIFGGNGAEGSLAILQGPQGQQGPKGEPGLNGKDADLKQVKELIRRHDNYKKNVTTNNLKKAGKFAALVGLVGLAAWGIKELFDKKKEKELVQETEPVAEQPVVEEKVEEKVTPNLPLNEDGTYTSVEGDNFNTIAARYLADKYRNEPDKFENLPQAEKEAMIDKECIRIMKLNGYEFDENRFNSKPPLYVPINVRVI